MYSLRETKDHSVLEICFDYIESLHPLGPFWDILSEYSLETNLEPKTVDILYNYCFIEDDRKIYFYCNAGFTVYVFNIGKAQYRTVYQRLCKICSELNRRLNEMRYLY